MKIATQFIGNSYNDVMSFVKDCLENNLLIDNSTEYVNTHLVKFTVEKMEEEKVFSTSREVLDLSISLATNPESFLRATTLSLLLSLSKTNDKLQEIKDILN